MKNLRRYFLAGLVSLLPIGVTLFVIIMALNSIALAVSRRRAGSAGK